MPIEIEKKYRLTQKRRVAVERRLHEIGASSKPVEFEENTLYRGGGLELGSCALRLRRVGARAILTFKQRPPSTTSINHQQEEEPAMPHAAATHPILPTHA